MNVEVRTRNELDMCSPFFYRKGIFKKYLDIQVTGMHEKKKTLNGLLVRINPFKARLSDVIVLRADVHVHSDDLLVVEMYVPGLECSNSISLSL